MPVVPSSDGACLTWDAQEKARRSAPWMVHLIRTFLAPDAGTARHGDDTFIDFTFDHHCDGIIAASRRDTGQLSLIAVTDNEVEEIVVMPGISEGAVWVICPTTPRRISGDAVRRFAGLPGDGD